MRNTIIVIITIFLVLLILLLFLFSSSSVTTKSLFLGRNAQNKNISSSRSSSSSSSSWDYIISQYAWIFNASMLDDGEDEGDFYHSDSDEELFIKENENNINNNNILVNGNMLFDFVSSSLQELEQEQEEQEQKKKTSTSSSSDKEMFLEKLLLLSKSSSKQQETQQLCSPLFSSSSSSTFERNETLKKECQNFCESPQTLEEAKKCSKILSQCLPEMTLACDSSSMKILKRLLQDVARQIFYHHHGKEEKESSKQTTTKSKTKTNLEKCNSWLQQRCVSRNVFTGEVLDRTHERQGFCLEWKINYVHNRNNHSSPEKIEIIASSSSPDENDSDNNNNKKRKKSQVKDENTIESIVQSAFSSPLVLEQARKSLKMLKLSSSSSSSSSSQKKKEGNENESANKEEATLLFVDLEHFPCVHPNEIWNCDGSGNCVEKKTPIENENENEKINKNNEEEENNVVVLSFGRSSSSSSKQRTILLPPTQLLSFPRTREASALFSSLSDSYSLMDAIISSSSSSTKSNENNNNKAKEKAKKHFPKCPLNSWYHRSLSTGTFCGTLWNPLPFLPQVIREELGDLKLRSRIPATTTSTIQTTKNENSQQLLLAFGKGKEHNARSFSSSVSRGIKSKIPLDWCENFPCLSSSSSSRKNNDENEEEEKEKENLPWDSKPNSGYTLSEVKLGVVLESSWKDYSSSSHYQLLFAAGGSAPVVLKDFRADVEQKQQREKKKTNSNMMMTMMIRDETIFDILIGGGKNNNNKIKNIKITNSSTTYFSSSSSSSSSSLSWATFIPWSISGTILSSSNEEKKKKKGTKTTTTSFSSSTQEFSQLIRELRQGEQSLRNMLKPNSLQDKALSAIAVNHRDLTKSLKYRSRVQNAYLAGILLLAALKK